MIILGISAFYHDSAACLVRNGEIVAAAQEERFTRKKHDASFPIEAIQYCLKEGSIKMSDVDIIAFYDKPFLKFERLLETYLAFAPFGIGSFLASMPVWIKEKLWLKDRIRKALNYQGKILFPEHHESHAASAFFPSPYSEAAILTIDGVGEWATTTYGVGRDNHIELLGELRFPHSLGLLYSAFTYYLGFKVNSGEYKVMGLAPYGEPRYKDIIYQHLIEVKEDGSFKLNMMYFNYAVGLTMTHERFHRLFGGDPRKPESPLTQRDMDLAASIQKVTEEVVIKMAHFVYNQTQMPYLCLAGGVALNCVANARILSECPFKAIWIQPAAGDAGGAIGSALMTWYSYLKNPRSADGTHDKQKGSLLGPAFHREVILSFLQKRQIPYEEYTESELVERVSDFIQEEKVIGWFQGRMEFGPRALGSRSIIGDARSDTMQEIMNIKIKFRESFRPFAPSILEEKANAFFCLQGQSPYMLLTAPVQKTIRNEMTEEEKKRFGLEKLYVRRSSIPAVTHVDYSARVQTVEKRTNPLFYRLLETFERKTGCPVIINTSFNVRGEPIVCRPEEAYVCFMRTHIDYLIMGPFILNKKNQPPLREDIDWRKTFEPD